MLSISCNGIVIYSLYQYVLSEEMSMDNEAKVVVVHNYYDEKVPASRYRRTVRYEAAKLSPGEYDILYELVTTNPFYSKKVELLRQVLKNYQFRKSCSNSPLPLVFKQAVYLLAYELCKGDYYDVAQKKALEDVGLSHNCFSKWNMHPKDDFKEQLHQQLSATEPPVTIPLEYQGKKNLALVNLVSELSKQIPYTKFVDVFGGSGAVTVGISKRLNARYYINDISTTQTHIYSLLRNHGEIFVKVVSEIYDIIHSISEASQYKDFRLCLFPEITTSEIIKIGKDVVTSSLEHADSESSSYYKKYKTRLDNYLEKHPETPISKNIYDPLPKDHITDYRLYQRHNDACESLYKKHSLQNTLSQPLLLYAKGLSKYFSRVVKQPEYFSPQQHAVASIFNESFSERDEADLYGYIALEVLKETYNNINLWKRVIHEFTSYKIKIFNQKDVEVVSRKDINCNDTLLYLDSPYIETVGYKVSYGKDEFVALHDELAKFSGYWIFSCRVGVNSGNSNHTIPNINNTNKSQRKYEALQFLFNLYSDIAKYVAFIKDEKQSDEDAFTNSKIKEIMLLNFSATAPDMNILRNLINGRINGANKSSIYRIISYEEFYPIAMHESNPDTWNQ